MKQTVSVGFVLLLLIALVGFTGSPSGFLAKESRTSFKSHPYHTFEQKPSIGLSKDPRVYSGFLKVHPAKPPRVAYEYARTAVTRHTCALCHDGTGLCIPKTQQAAPNVCEGRYLHNNQRCNCPVQEPVKSRYR